MNISNCLEGALENADDASAIAVFTSGGDAPGMNALVRAVVRMGIHYGREVYAIYEGYDGLVKGGDLIRPFSWSDTSLIIHQGGTVIGSARCAAFRTRSGRLMACKNLVEKGISYVVCCGGDGSLTGANIFKQEWNSLLSELLQNKEISEEAAKKCFHLNLVGAVGSIDNDMIYRGSMTIGADTALHRIVDAIDAVSSTASSHQRTFVLEIMGRQCGFLAWAAALATGADFVFIPECPPSEDDWETQLCSTLERRRARGHRLCTVLVAEGAVDRKGNPIKTAYVHSVIVDRLKHDTRTTILGHVQRGGHTSAYDRILGSVSGAMAVEKLLREKREDVSTIIGLEGFVPRFDSLVDSVAATRMVGEMINGLDFEKSMEARGVFFREGFRILKAINRDVAKHSIAKPLLKSICIVCSGAPAGGMNAAVRAACHYGMNYGYRVLAAQDGLTGLMDGKVVELGWTEVSAWCSVGGCKIYTDRAVDIDLNKFQDVVSKLGIAGIVLIGGFDALTSLVDMKDALAIPVAFIPATISNNVPGTDFSLGCDTAVNAVVSAIDTCKKSADASQRRLFIIETQGRSCGYLAHSAAIAGGADMVYTREQGITLHQLLNDLERVKDMIKRYGRRHFVLVRNEWCNNNYDLDFMERLFNEESKGVFSVRTVKLGHLCQGDYPSPLDRVRAGMFAATAMGYVIEQLETTSKGKVVVGTVGNDIAVTSLDTVETKMDRVNRTRTKLDWKWTVPLLNRLSKPYTHDDDISYSRDLDDYCRVTNESIKSEP